MVGATSGVATTKSKTVVGRGSGDAAETSVITGVD
jgi:hypothetical protein